MYKLFPRNNKERMKEYGLTNLGDGWPIASSSTGVQLVVISGRGLRRSRYPPRLDTRSFESPLETCYQVFTSEDASRLSRRSWHCQFNIIHWRGRWRLHVAVSANSTKVTKFVLSLPLYPSIYLHLRLSFFSQHRRLDDRAVYRVTDTNCRHNRLDLITASSLTFRRDFHGERNRRQRRHRRRRAAWKRKNIYLLADAIIGRRPSFFTKVRGDATER